MSTLKNSLPVSTVQAGMRAFDLECRFLNDKTRVLSTHLSSLETILGENYKFKGNNLQQKQSTVNKLNVLVVSLPYRRLIGSSEPVEQDHEWLFDISASPELSRQSNWNFTLQQQFCRSEPTHNSVLWKDLNLYF